MIVKWNIWWPALMVAALILILTSVPRDAASPGSSSLIEKGLHEHFLAFAVLGLLLRRALRHQWPGLSAGRVLLWVCVWGAIYGLVDELHQIPIPGRFWSEWDLAADALGACAGAVMATTWERWVKQRHGRQG